MGKRVWLSDDELASLGTEELRALVARHLRIFDGSSGYGFWDWNLKTSHFDWSGEFWQQLGYGDEDAEVINHPKRLIELIHPDDVGGARRALIDHVKNKKTFNQSYRLKAKNGEYRWSQCLCDSVRDEKGRAIYLSGINFDITHFKETETAMRLSEERQSRIIEGSNDGIWEYSFEEDLYYFSPRIFSMINLEVTEEQLADNQGAAALFRSRVVPEDLECYDSSWREHIKTHKPLDMEFRIIGGDDKLYWIRSRGQATINKEGRAVLISGTSSNITDRKEAEARALRSKEIAEKANQAKSQFLSSMSHELRTPLNAILGFSQLFDFEGNLTDRQRQNIGEIHKAGEHLLQLINDILDLAKIESGKLTLSLEPVLPVRIVEECIGLVQSMADARRIAIHLQTDGFENAFVHADAVRLKQVLLNLMSNAIKYNRDSGSMSVVFSSGSEDKLSIKVEDTGFGIPEKLQKNVFEPFNRLGAENSATEGSGVGLVITKQLVEIMGGSIQFNSVVGEGSYFEITLKRSEEWTAEKAKTNNGRIRGESTTLNFASKRRVLYIEDNISNLRLMQQLLGRFDQIVLETANEAFQGLYRARTTSPDLVILDINLPGMDGFEALKVLKQDPFTQAIPVIALSANAMTHDVERGLAAGFDAYLTKPVVYSELIGTLNDLIGGDKELDVAEAVEKEVS